MCNLMPLSALDFALSTIGGALNTNNDYTYFLQTQSSVSVSKTLVKTVEHVRNMPSATHVIVHQGTMVPCVKMVSIKPSKTM